MDGTLHVNDGTVVGDNVAYVYLNDNGRNLNRNQLDNRWNRSYRFVRARKSLMVYHRANYRWRGWFFPPNPCGNTGVFVLRPKRFLALCLGRAAAFGGVQQALPLRLYGLQLYSFPLDPS